MPHHSLRTLLLLAVWLLATASQHQERTPTPKMGKDYALFFAVDDYRPNPNFDNLANPIKDANALAAELDEMYAFDTKVYENPSRNKIFQVIQQYLRRSYAEDAQLFVFFSGHGDFNDLVSKGYFIPYGNDPGIDLTDLGNAITKIPCRHILLAIDACFSGTIDQEIAFRGRFDRPGVTSDSERERTIDLLLRNQSRLLITSGGKQRTPDGTNHSPFSEAILNGLRAAYLPNNDGLFIYEDLLGRLLRVSPTPHNGALRGHEEGSFVFVVRPSPSLKPMATSGCIEGDCNSGVGTYVYQDGIKYVGTFRNGRPNGLGQLFYLDGNRYEGAFKDGNLDGYGTLHFLDGRILSGQWEENSYVGDTLTTPSQLNTSGTPTLRDNLILIRGGTFQMGDTFGEGGLDEKPVHSVTLSDFYLSPYEVTFEQYDRFCTATKRAKPDDEGWGRGQLPVINVSWEDAIAYCNWLSADRGLRPAYRQSGASWVWDKIAKGYRLPTEAEWEYAARAGGKKVRFGNGKNTADPAEINFDASERYKQPYSVAGVYRSKTVAVGSLISPNALGLQDMSGNIYEWCWDWYGDYSSGSSSNPSGPSTSSYRVLRGGSWFYYPQYCRAAYRSFNTPTSRDRNVGFRLARSI